MVYKHTIQYYETDKMGITHHSNYVRWMEEARIDFLKQCGYGFDKMEADGIISPVVSVECTYKKSTTFPENVFIEVQVEEFKGAKLKLRYVMKNESGDIVCEGHSSHGFLNEKGMPIRMQKEFPEYYQALSGLIPCGDGQK